MNNLQRFNKQLVRNHKEKYASKYPNRSEKLILIILSSFFVLFLYDPRWVTNERSHINKKRNENLNENIDSEKLPLKQNDVLHNVEIKNLNVFSFRKIFEEFSKRVPLKNPIKLNCFDLNFSSNFLDSPLNVIFFKQSFLFFSHIQIKIFFLHSFKIIQLIKLLITYCD